MSKNTSFVTLASELFRLTETYSVKALESNRDDQYLLSSDYIMDFTKDLNIREVQFVEIFENYKKIGNFQWQNRVQLMIRFHS